MRVKLTNVFTIVGAVLLLAIIRPNSALAADPNTGAKVAAARTADFSPDEIKAIIRSWSLSDKKKLGKLVERVAALRAAEDAESGAGVRMGLPKFASVEPVAARSMLSGFGLAAAEGLYVTIGTYVTEQIYNHTQQNIVKTFLKSDSSLSGSYVYNQSRLIEEQNYTSEKRREALGKMVADIYYNHQGQNSR